MFAEHISVSSGAHFVAARQRPRLMPIVEKARPTNPYSINAASNGSSTAAGYSYDGASSSSSAAAVPGALAARPTGAGAGSSHDRDIAVARSEYPCRVLPCIWCHQWHWAVHTARGTIVLILILTPCVADTECTRESAGPALFHLDDYLTCTAHIYYGARQVGAHTSSFSIIRRSVLGMLTSPVRLGYAFEWWQPYEVALLEASVLAQVAASGSVDAVDWTDMSMLLRGQKTGDECKRLWAAIADLYRSPTAAAAQQHQRGPEASASSSSSSSMAVDAVADDAGRRGGNGGTADQRQSDVTPPIDTTASSGDVDAMLVDVQASSASGGEGGGPQASAVEERRSQAAVPQAQPEAAAPSSSPVNAADAAVDSDPMAAFAVASTATQAGQLPQQPAAAQRLTGQSADIGQSPSPTAAPVVAAAAAAPKLKFVFKQQAQQAAPPPAPSPPPVLVQLPPAQPTRFTLPPADMNNREQPEQAHFRRYLACVRSMYKLDSGPVDPLASAGVDATSGAYRSRLGMLVSPCRQAAPFDRWCPIEIARFESAVCLLGKCWPQIAVAIGGSKTAAECIEFYYTWKQCHHYPAWKACYSHEHSDTEWMVALYSHETGKTRLCNM